MSVIRPVTDLQNDFAEISKIVHEDDRPVYLTKDGYGDMVVMSMKSYESMRFENVVFAKLSEAERAAELTDERFSSDEVLAAMKDAIGNV